jgi:hypothetical protein
VSPTGASWAFERDPGVTSKEQVMSQIAVVAGDGGQGPDVTKADSPDALRLGALGAATDAISESRRVSALASDELAAWASVLHRAA